MGQFNDIQEIWDLQVFVKFLSFNSSALDQSATAPPIFKSSFTYWHRMEIHTSYQKVETKLRLSV